MKIFLKYANFIAAGLLLLAFIFTLAFPGVIQVFKTGSTTTTTPFAGGQCIFGGGDMSLKATWVGIISFIFVILALLATAALIILPLLKITALDKYATLITYAVAALVFLTGIFTFCIVPAFCGANGVEGIKTSYSTGYFAIGGGWFFAGIFYILSALSSVAPSILPKFIK